MSQFDLWNVEFHVWDQPHSILCTWLPFRTCRLLCKSACEKCLFHYKLLVTSHMSHIRPHQLCKALIKTLICFHSRLRFLVWLLERNYFAAVSIKNKAPSVQTFEHVWWRIVWVQACCDVVKLSGGPSDTNTWRHFIYNRSISTKALWMTKKGCLGSLFFWKRMTAPR